jgi:hypothetical protein
MGLNRTTEKIGWDRLDGLSRICAERRDPRTALFDSP